MPRPLNMACRVRRSKVGIPLGGSGLFLWIIVGQNKKTYLCGEQKNIVMETVVKKAKKQPAPKISKLGQWMLDHKEGIFIVNDRKAVNK